MVARAAISVSHFVKPRGLSVQTSKLKSGKRSSNASRNARVHQGNEEYAVYETSVRDLGLILRTLRVNQIYGDGDSSVYDPVIDLVKMRIREIKVQNLTQQVDDYMACCSDIERERFYSRFSSWKPTVRHAEFTHDDKIMEAQVRLHEITERCRDFEEREKAFKLKTFGRLASRIDF
jgi:hypothetical protein